MLDTLDKRRYKILRHHCMLSWNFRIQNIQKVNFEMGLCRTNFGSRKKIYCNHHLLSMWEVMVWNLLRSSRFICKILIALQPSKALAHRNAQRKWPVYSLFRSRFFVIWRNETNFLCYYGWILSCVSSCSNEL